jgi:hypothetical protein
MLSVVENGPIHIDDLELDADLGAAEWVTERIHDFGTDFGSILPEGFAAYARVFHPASRGLQAVRWSEIAAANETVMHPGAQFEAISGVDPWRDRQPEIWDQPPECGELPLDVATRLVDILRQHTSTPLRCWFCVWEGWGGMANPTRARVQLPARNYLLVRAPITAALGAFEFIGARGASLWWPDDRAWFVATEIDFRWTYVGGSTGCIDAVLSDGEIEALPVGRDHRFRIDSDQINPLPDGIV